MCRIAAYIGPSIPLENIIVQPEHSLLSQSQHANEAKLAVNGDGFGLAWYDGQSAVPGLYRDVLPAWSDGNLTSICRMVRSPLFIGHVRASTMGETSRSNCHPFAHGAWSFCHNGQVPYFLAMRRRMEAALPDDLYNTRRGTTDSEMLFLTLLALGLRDDPMRALAALLEAIGPETRAGPVRLTCVFSDGGSLFGFRHSRDGKSPTLYLGERLDNGGRALASEPLSRCGTWTALAPRQVIRLDAGGAASLGHLPPIGAVVA